MTRVNTLRLLESCTTFVLTRKTDGRQSFSGCRFRYMMCPKVLRKCGMLPGARPRHPPLSTLPASTCDNDKDILPVQIPSQDGCVKKPHKLFIISSSTVLQNCSFTVLQFYSFTVLPPPPPETSWLMVSYVTPSLATVQSGAELVVVVGQKSDIIWSIYNEEQGPWARAVSKAAKARKTSKEQTQIVIITDGKFGP